MEACHARGGLQLSTFAKAEMTQPEVEARMHSYLIRRLQ